MYLDVRLSIVEHKKIMFLTQFINEKKKEFSLVIHIRYREINL